MTIDGNTCSVGTFGGNTCIWLIEIDSKNGTNLNSRLHSLYSPSETCNTESGETI